MVVMQRIYSQVVQDHFDHYQQMVLLNGPRQVGKTTISKSLSDWTDHFTYINWDIQEDRQQILLGQRHLAQTLRLNALNNHVVVVFDELHKYVNWKNFLKGFFDGYKEQCHILVTGSQKLEIARKKGDSLMGRYFPFRVHPLSVAECIRSALPTDKVTLPTAMDSALWKALWQFGGYPDPLVKQEQRFLRRWQNLRMEQLFRDDIRNLTQIHELSQLEVLAELLKRQVGKLVNYTNLGNKVNVTTKTVQQWITTLERFYFCFRILPWHKNISRSLLKEPKLYLWDWSDIDDIGAKFENFIACHLLKAVHFWTDYGFGQFKLYFIRTKDKKEVDFIVTKDDQPWFLVEAKYSDNRGISESLYHFQKVTGADHAFQVVYDLDYIEADCFAHKHPIIVPASTFLSQLI